MSFADGIRPHAFTNGDREYVYDPGTNQIYGVDPLVARVVTGADPPDAAIAIQELEEAGLDGLLQPYAPGFSALCTSCQTSGDDRFIHHLTLSVTERCDLRCAYCSHTHEGQDWQRGHGSRSMDRSTLERAVEHFLEHSIDAPSPMISFYGGEALLEPELLAAASRLVREAGRDDIRLIVDTNGYGLDDPDIVAMALEFGWHFQISLDGPAHIHDAHRRHVSGGPTHARILSGLDRLLRSDPAVASRLRLQATVVAGDTLVEVADWFAAFPPYRDLGINRQPHVGVNLADLNGIDPSAPGLGSGEDRCRAEAIDVLRMRYVRDLTTGGPDAADPVCRDLFEHHLIKWFHRDRRDRPAALSPSGCCRLGERRLHVTVDGVYQPCERVGTGMTIGSVACGVDHAAADVLLEDFVSAFGDECRSCWAVRHCGLCVAMMASGPDREGREGLCAGVRAGLEERFRLWLDVYERDPAALDFLKSSTLV